MKPIFVFPAPKALETPKLRIDGFESTKWHSHFVLWYSVQIFLSNPN